MTPLTSSASGRRNKLDFLAPSGAHWRRKLAFRKAHAAPGWICRPMDGASVSSSSSRTACITLWMSNRKLWLSLSCGTPTRYKRADYVHKTQRTGREPLSSSGSHQAKRARHPDVPNCWSWHRSKIRNHQEDVNESRNNPHHRIGGRHVGRRVVRGAARTSTARQFVSHQHGPARSVPHGPQ